MLRTLWLTGASPVIRNPATVWLALLGLAVVHPVCTPRSYRHEPVPSRIILCPATAGFTSSRLALVFARSEPDDSPFFHCLLNFFPARTGFCPFRARFLAELAMAERLLPGSGPFAESPSPLLRRLAITKWHLTGLAKK